MIAGISNIIGISKVYAGTDLVWQLAPVEVPLFVETFPNATTGDTSLSTVNWFIVSGSASAALNTSGNNISSAVGKGEAVSLNAGYTSGQETDKGLIYLSSGNPALFMTEKTGIDRALYNTLRFSCYVGHSALRNNNFMVKVGEQWYMTTVSYKQQVAVSSAANFSVGAEPYIATVNLNTDLWFRVSWVVGTSITQDFSEQVLLPSGNITGVGLRCGDAAGIARMDSYSITAI